MSVVFWFALSSLSVAPPEAESASIEGTLVDARDYLPRRDVTVNLRCVCDRPVQTTRSGATGEFRFDGLPPGRYRLELWGGEGVTRHEYTLAPGQARTLVLAVPPSRLPPRDTRNLPVYGIYSRNPGLLLPQLELSVGGVLLAGGLIMLVAGAVEASKPACDFGQTRCDASPRPRVAAGLAFGGGASATAGAVLLGLGAAHLRRWRLGLQVARDGGGLAWAGSF